MENIPQEKEDLFYGLFEKANAVIIYLDVYGNIIISNKKLEDLSGKNNAEAVGIYWLDVIHHTKDSAIKKQMFRSVMDDSVIYKRVNNFEGTLTDREGKERFISWSITPILSEADKLAGVLLIGNDITELKEREASLRNIDDTLKNIISGIKEYALYVTNLDGNITYYGMGSEKMFGWQKSEIAFKHVGMLHNPDDAQSKLPGILKQVRETGRYEAELELINKEGLPFPAILITTQFLDTDGKMAGYIFIAKDITERKKFEYQIFQAEKLAALGQLVAGLAHEINNPLFVISGRLEMLEMEAALPQALKENVAVISAQADRIRKLVDQMLKFSRQKTLKLELVNVNDIIEGVLPLLAYHKLPSARIEISKEFEQGIPKIKAELNQLQEVFVNLFLNAYQAMPDGGRLLITTRSLDKLYAEIKISDSGSGIAPQNLKNIFMPFFSTKREGTGLGLSICHNIIKNHNGTIEVESLPGKGTTFTIKLPFAQ